MSQPNPPPPPPPLPTSPYHVSTATPPPPPPKTTAYASDGGNHLAGPPVPPLPSQQSLSSNHGNLNYPPRTSSQTPYTSTSLPEARTPASHEQHQQHQNPLQQEQRPLPTPSGSYLPPTLTQKSKADLQHLLSTPALLESLLYAPSTSHPSLTASITPLNQHLEANIVLAQHLASLHTQLLAERERVQTHLLTVRALESRWRKKQSELESKLEPWGPRELHQRLVAGIGEQEGFCVGLEESFLEDDGGSDGFGGGVKGERETQEWVKRVREGRRVWHLRRSRRERWDEGRVGGWR